MTIIPFGHHIILELTIDREEWSTSGRSANIVEIEDRLPTTVFRNMTVVSFESRKDMTKTVIHQRMT